MKRVLTVTTLALFGLAPAVGGACEDTDAALSASAPKPALAPSASASSAASVPASAVAKATAPNAAKPDATKGKAAAPNQKLAAASSN
jgi:hypothetical protein